MRSRYGVLLLEIVLFPVARVVHRVAHSKPFQTLIDRHYRKNPLDLLDNEGERWFHAMCGTIGDSLMPGRPNEYTFQLTEKHRWTEPVKTMILFRVQPAWMSTELFLEMVLEQAIAARGTRGYGNYKWHLGCDEHGDLYVHLHTVHANHEPSQRTRAKVVKMDFSVRFANGRIYEDSDINGRPDNDMVRSSR